MVPGNYSVDGHSWQFWKCMDTGYCYAGQDNNPNLSRGYAGLHELLRLRHPELTSSGQPRSFNVKNTICFLDVPLAEWEQKGERFLLQVMVFSQI